ncbi:hypothetical protein WMY93_025508 [Mugilogobius chulae]|uniref:Uncharacterized protein n=1 Tax=Mugilogobius chulae TaxID=88201 RepID=A0AAW0MUW1_9GOBI
MDRAVHRAVPGCPPDAPVRSCRKTEAPGRLSHRYRPRSNSLCFTITRERPENTAQCPHLPQAVCRCQCREAAMIGTSSPRPHEPARPVSCPSNTGVQIPTASSDTGPDKSDGACVRSAVRVAPRCRGRRTPVTG